jgi:hypothetical protein
VPVLAWGAWAACAAAGALLTLAWDRVPGRLAERLAAGLALGVTLLGIGSAALAPLLGFPAASGVALLLLLCAGAGVAARCGRTALAPRRPAATSLLAGLLAAAAIAVPMSRAVWIDARGLFTGADHNLGDLPFHLGIVHAFVEGDGTRPEHPELSGVPLTYSWAVDSAVAAASALGAPVAAAMNAQGIALAAGLVVLLWTWGRELTGSRGAALLVPALALLNGGTGAFRLIAEAGSAEAAWSALAQSPHDVTIHDPWGLRWGNALAVLLIPQRAFLLGLPLGLYASLLAWRALAAERGTAEERRALTGVGVTLGLMPLAHAHSALATGLALALAALPFRRPGFVRAFALAAVLALPQVFALSAGSGTGLASFVAVQLGWDRGEQGIAGFWWRNAGPYLLLAGLAFALLRRERTARFLAGAGVLFVVPNLLRLSPWIWDNVKLLFWAHVLAAPLVALLLARVAARGRAAAGVAAALFVITVTSGAVDAWRLASGGRGHRLFDADALAFGAAIAGATRPGDRLLTAPAHDHPALLSGRPQYLGYEGHIWSQGLDGSGRRERIAAAYAGDRAAWRELRAAGVTAAVVGPRERALFPGAAAAFEGRRLLASAGSWSLYALDLE